MPDPTLHIRAFNRDAVGDVINQIDITAQALGALPQRPALHAVGERWGRRLFRRKGFRQKFTVQLAPSTVMASGHDFGDIRALEDALVNRDEVYLVKDNTLFYRTNTTSGDDHDFWKGVNGILEAGPLRVQCTSGPEISPDFQTGSEKVTFTLEVVEPNT